MKKICLFIVLCLTFLEAKIATVVALKGDVIIQRNGEFTMAKLNSKVEERDIITTKKDARVQLLFSDNTMISIGKNSTFGIKEYLFDLGKKPKLAFKFGYGTFKAITGKIGKLNPRGFKLETKTASIGIRGTIVEIESDQENETFLVPKGKIELKIGTQTIILSAGQMVTKKRNRVVSKPKRISREIRERIERESGAKDNERESGFGERTETKSVNSVEKCNYR